MPIEISDVRHIASLAKLELDAATLETFRQQLQQILDYVAMLDALDVDQTPPTSSTLDAGQPLRGDDPHGSLPSGEALGNAPDAAEGHFRVPRVIRG